MKQISKLKSWLWGSSEDGSKKQNKTKEESVGTWNAADASASIWGIKTQNSGSWFKKGLPLIIVLALIYWAAIHFISKHDIGYFGNNQTSNQTLEANIEGVSENNYDDFSSNKNKNIVSTSAVKLPNGEIVEFSKGSIGEKVCSWLDLEKDKSTAVFTFENSYFRNGSAELQQEAKMELNTLAKILNAYPTVQITIEGHANYKENAAANPQKYVCQLPF